MEIFYLLDLGADCKKSQLLVPVSSCQHSALINFAFTQHRIIFPGIVQTTSLFFFNLRHLYPINV